MEERITEKAGEVSAGTMEEKTEMPVVALRGKVFFPNTFLNFDVGRPASVAAVNAANGFGNRIFIVAQKNSWVESPARGDLLSYGVVARIKQVVRISGGSAMKVYVEGLYRGKITEWKDGTGYFCAAVEKAPYILSADEITTEAYLRTAKNAFIGYAEGDKRINPEMIATVTDIKDPNSFTDNAISVSKLKDADAQALISENDTVKRLEAFSRIMLKEKAIGEIEREINAKVRAGIDKSQKEYYLREQIKAIHNELGDDKDVRTEIIERLKRVNPPTEVVEKANKELDRLDKINPSMPDYSVIFNYLDWLCELPFGVSTTDRESLTEAIKILDGDHFGLEKVKQRIVEYLAVHKLTGELKGPILCFVGPPGVGKTSVASSIARALGRKFVRMSLGGVKDEAEIRGHRKTYVGAMPGRIISGLKTAGSNNPVFLLDEIDKMSSDIHGDPASALLEVLDPSQNSTFRDRYLELPFDLSKVLFITTANSTEGIPAPLLDRMELIELSGYTPEEKFEIAKRYLISKQLKNNGLTADRIIFQDSAITEIVDGYTMEAGVRNLEREIGSVIRKVAAKVAEHPRLKPQTITAETVKDYLGVRKFVKEETLGKNEVGACTGLAWTAVGGVTLTIEVSLFSGKGEILLTGKLGDVMKESARAAISYIHAHAKEYGLSEDKFTGKDIHIHVPEGATPKDGPSAGITMATAILSAFTGKPVKKDVAMTGEITLRGRVLPIGGLKEKALAAYRSGVSVVVIPKANLKDLADVPKSVRRKIKFIPCETVEEVFSVAVDGYKK